MSNIFSSIQKYGEGWSVKSTRQFSQEEADAVKSASVVSSEFGLSVCFMLKAGGMAYIPTSKNANLGEGEVIAVDKLTEHKLVTLEQSGKADIVRFE